MEPKIIARLKEAIRAAHGCEALYMQTVHVDQRSDAASGWDGSVNVFELIGHPKAKHCYAWKQDDRTFTMLHLSPITSPDIAVKVAHAQVFPRS
jgi:hypothetical protein